MENKPSKLSFFTLVFLNIFGETSRPSSVEQPSLAESSAQSPPILFDRLGLSLFFLNSFLFSTLLPVCPGDSEISIVGIFLFIKNNNILKSKKIYYNKKKK